MSFHGLPCWFELSVPDPDAAEVFYDAALGWAWSRVDMGAFDYHLAQMGEVLVAGGFPLAACPPGTPPNWMIYIAVDDCDASAAQAVALGGKIWKDPDDIPGTGRFAILGDPQGAVFGILQPLPMDPPSAGGAFDPEKVGHGNWIELTSADPAAALEFYGALFGWREDARHDMGPAGLYRIIAHQDRQIGGISGLGQSPFSFWLPYFGCADLADTLDTLKTAGGVVMHGPQEVPGPAMIAVARDPQGAFFALVGPKP